MHHRILGKRQGEVGKIPPVPLKVSPDSYRGAGVITSIAVAFKRRIKEFLSSSALATSPKQMWLKPVIKMILSL